jgi:hypothetical protein
MCVVLRLIYLSFQGREISGGFLLLNYIRELKADTVIMASKSSNESPVEPCLCAHFYERTFAQFQLLRICRTKLSEKEAFVLYTGAVGNAKSNNKFRLILTFFSLLVLFPMRKFD